MDLDGLKVKNLQRMIHRRWRNESTTRPRIWHNSSQCKILDYDRIIIDGFGRLARLAFLKGIWRILAPVKHISGTNIRLLSSRDPQISNNEIISILFRQDTNLSHKKVARGSS